jgi:hypothetical protein
MAGFCSLRTLFATGCLMIALLAGGSVRAISFSAIEVPQPSWAPSPLFASPLDVSPDGNRVAGLVTVRDLDYDCGSYLGCTSAFSWSFPDGTTVSGQHTGTWGQIPGNAEQGVQVSQQHSLYNAQAGPILVAAGSGIETSLQPSAHIFLRSYGMAEDGTVVVGSYSDLLSGSRKPFRWTSESGLEQIELPAGLSDSIATVISADGSVIAGVGFVWTDDDGASELVDVLPQAISSNGNTIVGYSTDVYDSTPNVWHSDTGTATLQLMQESDGGAAFDTTATGNLIVGQIYTGTDLGPLGGLNGGLLLPESTLIWLDPTHMAMTHVAVLWDADGNVHNLQTWLAQHHNLGPQLTGWSLISANAISADGRVIAGVGINPDGHFQGWVVDLSPAQVIPEPATSLMLLAPLSLIIAGWVRTRRPG